MVNRLSHPNCRRNITWAHVTWAHVMLRVQLGCEAIYHWILWRRFTLLSLCVRHVISRASMPLTFLLSHTFRETWRRDLRVECSSDVISCFQKNILFMSVATLKPIRMECYLPRLPGAKSSHEITWHDDMHVCHLTWREDSVSTALWMGEQSVARTSTWQYITLRTDRYLWPRRGSNPQSQQASGHRPTS